MPKPASTFPFLEWPSRFSVRALGSLALTLLGTACGDGGTGPDAGSLTVVPVDDVRPGTMLTVVVPEGGALNAAVEGSLGEVPIALAVQDDSTLIGLTPEVSAGTKQLKIKIGDRAGETSVQVAAGMVIANPAQTITNSLDAALSRASSAAPAGFSEADWAAHRVTMDSLVQDAKAKAAALGPEDQLALARLIESVESDPAYAASGLSFYQASLSSQALLPAGCLKTVGRAIAAGSKTLKGLGVFAGGIVLSATGAGTALGVAVGGYGALLMYESWPTTIMDVREVWTNGTCSRQEAIVVETDPFADLSRSSGDTRSALSSAAAETPFHKGVPVRFHLGERVRPLDKTDADDPELSALSAMIESIYDLLDMLPTSVRDLLPNPPPLLSTVPPGEVTTRALSSSSVRLGNVTPSTVKLTSSGSGPSLLLTADGEIDKDTPFTVDVVSLSDSTIRTKISGVLKLPPTGGWYTGTYRLSAPWEGAETCGSQLGQTGELTAFAVNEYPYPVVIYSKSILPGMPSLYFKTPGGHRFRPPEYRVSPNLFRLDQLVMTPNISIDSYLEEFVYYGGYATQRRENGISSRRCDQYVYHYSVFTSARYAGEVLPAGLTVDPQVVNEMLADPRNSFVVTR